MILFHGLVVILMAIKSRNVSFLLEPWVGTAAYWVPTPLFLGVKTTLAFELLPRSSAWWPSTRRIRRRLSLFLRVDHQPSASSIANVWRQLSRVVSATVTIQGSMANSLSSSWSDDFWHSNAKVLKGSALKFPGGGSYSEEQLMRYFMKNSSLTQRCDRRRSFKVGTNPRISSK